MIRHERTNAWNAPGANHSSASISHRFFLCPAHPRQMTREGYGAIHYIGIAGLGEKAAQLPSGHRDAGVFGYDRSTTPRDIKDGLATTLLFLETTQIIGPSWLAGGRSSVRGLDPDDAPFLGRSGQFGSFHPASWIGNEIVLHAVFADLSIRLLHQKIDSNVLQALVTIAGDEEVSLGDL